MLKIKLDSAVYMEEDAGGEFSEGIWDEFKFVWSALQVVGKENMVKVLGVRQVEYLPDKDHR